MFNIDLHFQGRMSQELDDQTQSDHFIENLMKIGWMVLEMFNVFLRLFSMWHIFHLEN